MPLQRAQERAHVARTTIELIKTVYAGRNPRGSQRLGGQVETLLISGVVLIGHVEGKPKTASAVARYLGVPRVTVLRKLAGLCNEGVIERKGRHYCMAPDPKGVDFAYIDAALAIINGAARK